MKRAYDFSPRINMLQFRVLFARYLKQTVSNPWVIIPMFLQAPVLLLISSFVYEDGTFYEQWAHPTSANCMPFLLVLSAALMGLLNSYREICKERDILRREVFGGLDVTAYVGSKVTVQAIAGGVQSIIVAFGSLTFIDYNMARPGYSLFFLLAAVFLTNYAMTAVGLLVSALLKKSESAILPIIVIIILQVVFAGALIEEAGLKGLSVGGAQVSELHAGFIVNTGGATSSDIISLMKLVQNTVRDKSGIELVPEVRIIGRD